MKEIDDTLSTKADDGAQKSELGDKCSFSDEL
jgi:hypothetical protein